MLGSVAVGVSLLLVIATMAIAIGVRSSDDIALITLAFLATIVSGWLFVVVERGGVMAFVGLAGQVAGLRWLAATKRERRDAHE